MRNKNTKEVRGVHYNTELTDTSEIDTEGGKEFVEITQREFENYSNKPLILAKYKYDKANGFQENVIKKEEVVK